MASYRTHAEIGAPPAIVFAQLATAEGLAGWLGHAARIDPVPGGRFQVDIGAVTMAGEVLALEPPHRLVLSWGLVGSPDFPPGASRLSFRLRATAGGTRVDLVHTGLPDARGGSHVEGWRHFVPRLVRAATGLPVETEFWMPGGGRAGA